MKCPKCGYLGFDSGDRCKNCGYDFSLLNHDEATSPLRDPHLARGARYRKTSDAGPGAGVERRLVPAPEGTPIDLPLFGEGALPPPRAPIAVRRSTPTPSRVRARSAGPPRPVELKLDLEVPAPSIAPAPRAVNEPVTVRQADPPDVRSAPPSRRAGAAALDLGLVAGIDLVLLWFALRLCGLSPSDILVLPPLPLLAFFALLDSGYVILFTGTLGQTLGKMAVGIQIVTVAPGNMSLGRAALRAIVSIVSVLPAGLGFLPAAFGSGRPLHDWVAGTRVVQV